jgi:hypothetical protein
MLSLSMLMTCACRCTRCAMHGGTTGPTFPDMDPRGHWVKASRRRTWSGGAHRAQSEVGSPARSTLAWVLPQPGQGGWWSAPETGVCGAEVPRSTDLGTMSAVALVASASSYRDAGCMQQRGCTAFVFGMQQMQRLLHGFREPCCMAKMQHLEHRLAAVRQRDNPGCGVLERVPALA